MPTFYSNYRGILLEDGARHGDTGPIGTATAVSYSFPTGGDLPTRGELSDGESVNRVAAISAADQRVVRAALAEYSKVSGIQFVEINRGGTLEFVRAATADNASWGEEPSGGTQYVVLASALGSLAQNDGAFDEVLRAIGFASGLGDPGTGANRLVEQLDDRAYTVMAESYGDPDDFTTDHLERLDVAALQHLYGSPIDDDLVVTWNAARGAVVMRGTPGVDTFAAALEPTAMGGQAGNDRFYGNVGDDTIRGGTGKDYVEGGAGDDQLFGDGGNDSVFGGSGADRILGGAGADLLSGDDPIQSGDLAAYDDTLIGGTDNDKLFGWGGGDLMDGGTGNDSVVGGAGNDTINGADGNDTVEGGAGDDVVRSGAGNDVVSLGAGIDLYVSTPGDGSDVIRDFLVGVDEINVTRHGIDLADARIVGRGDHTLIAFDDGTQLLLLDVDRADFLASL
ncbi:hypothetical protein [Acuticoccus sp. I52.16.1]|uniref:hypothetical protein n=1 Tax=Acuticoccus sp. I52.16.1 TaxID=2928472 RepID=UPI001FD4912C|nr:hypothetical protein [Acuticoccus sp. I52.16.1]UOM34460.1 hypothetical protein MRB58_22035 [Acuticoccus sp. I52.16.1]